MKKIIRKGETSVGLGDGVLLIDDKQIYSTKNLKVGLFKSNL
jgi:3-hydroxyacyl-[acyl-carrier protein] dehydratase/trans-2-decenoyl-[acyl-carrier protein] isomerase